MVNFLEILGRDVTKGTVPAPHQKMRAQTAPSFTKFNPAHLTRTAESSQNPGAPAGRVLAQNEFPSKNNGRANGAPIHSIPFSLPDPNGRVATEPRGRAQGLASQ